MRARRGSVYLYPRRSVDEKKGFGPHDEEERLCALCGGEIEGKYFRVGHLLSPHKLAVCDDCFEGRKTWMELKDEYFGPYVDRYREMEDEVRRGYEK